MKFTESLIMDTEFKQLLDKWDNYNDKKIEEQIPAMPQAQTTNTQAPSGQTTAPATTQPVTPTQTAASINQVNQAAQKLNQFANLTKKWQTELQSFSKDPAVLKAFDNFVKTIVQK